MAYSVQHTQQNIARPYWYQLEAYNDPDKAIHRARNYALDHGGYVCVKDHTGKVVFGTDPVQLDRAVAEGRNRDFAAA